MEPKKIITFPEFVGAFLDELLDNGEIEIIEGSPEFEETEEADNEETDDK